MSLSVQRTTTVNKDLKTPCLIKTISSLLQAKMFHNPTVHAYLRGKIRKVSSKIQTRCLVLLNRNYCKISTLNKKAMVVSMQEYCDCKHATLTNRLLTLLQTQILNLYLKICIINAAINRLALCSLPNYHLHRQHLLKQYIQIKMSTVIQQYLFMQVVKAPPSMFAVNLKTIFSLTCK